MTACKRHSESPVKGYNQCAGCEIEALRAELEAARGLLREVRIAARINPSCQYGMVNPCRCGYCVDLRVDAFLTATPAPEVPDHIADASKMVEQRAITVERDFIGTMHIKVGDFDAVQVRYQYPYTDNASTRRLAERIADMLRNPQAEQGERQEAVAWALANSADEIGGFAPIYYTKEGAISWANGRNIFPLYTTPQPGQDVRGLAASLYQACGAYDMPERILDALSAAANGEPFTHMIDGLLPCVPPSGEDVRSLVEALEECAASLAWNCFGECRAVHAGPIMPAAKALDAARTALAYHRQAQIDESEQ